LGDEALPWLEVVGFDPARVSEIAVIMRTDYGASFDQERTDFRGGLADGSPHDSDPRCVQHGVADFDRLDGARSRGSVDHRPRREAARELIQDRRVDVIAVEAVGVV
jgi:hypothetical protein